MGNLICFKLGEDIVYCPIHLNNNVLTNNEGGYSDFSVREETLLQIVKELDENLNYILDFSMCIGTVESTPEIIKMLNSVKVLVLTDENFKGAFSTQSDTLQIKIEQWGAEENNFWIIKFDENVVLNQYIDELENPIGGLRPSDYFSKLVLTTFFYNDIKENPKYDFSKRKKYLDSSNVYVNKYINVKSLFLDYDHMMLVVSELAKLINERFKKYHGQISLLGVSNNGIILANMLSYELDAMAYSLNRLGPVYCLEDKVNGLGDFEDKKYILVSDVICMGGEYRMAKGIVDILGSELLGGISVVKVRDVYRREHGGEIFAVIDDINQFRINGQSIDYQVFIDDEISEQEE